MKSALIVGASSMLGEELAHRLARDGCVVYRCGRRPEDDIRLCLGENAPVEVPQGLEVETVYHCAASFEGDDWAGAWKNEKVNALGCLQVAELAHKCGCRHLVYAGTIFSLGEEDTLSSYGASKLRGEGILSWSLSRAGILFTSLRFSQFYDSWGRCFTHQPWFRRILAYADAGRDLRMPPYEALRNFIHVEDAARLLLAVARKGLAGVFPVSHPESLTCGEMADMAYKRFGKGGRVILAEEKTPFREILIPDSRETYAALGCAPEIDMEEGVSRLFRNRAGCDFGPLDVA